MSRVPPLAFLAAILSACASPDSSEPLLRRRAEIAETQGRWVDASEAWYELLSSSGGDDVDAARGLARALAAGGDHAGAARILRAAAKRTRDDALLAFDLATQLRALGLLDEALAELELAAAVAPNWSAPLTEAGTLLLDMGDDQAALDRLERALLLSPEDRGIWRAVARTRATLGRAAGAFEAWRRSGALGTLTTDEVRELAQLYVAGDRVSVGGETRAWLRGELERTLQQTPQASWAHSALGQLALQAGELEQTMAHLRRAAEIDPGDLGILLQLGELYRGAGRQGELQALVGHALALTEDSEARLAFESLLSERTEDGGPDAAEGGSEGN